MYVFMFYFWLDQLSEKEGGGGGGEGSRDGTVVRTLASHQCGLHLIPGLANITWVEFVVGSCPFSESFFSGYSGFSSPQKPTLLNSNSIWKESPISALYEINRHLYKVVYFVIFSEGLTLYTECTSPRVTPRKTGVCCVPVTGQNKVSR